ncbi:MAG: RluA family pseudouridine synthase [Candidatus Margulisiibacteriota bacterium]|jgi:23S rRNA pseudouridine1911/1915/1917 synthase
MNNVPEIIYQDEYILVLNKPVGLVVHKGEGVKEEFTLVDFLLEKHLIESGDWNEKDRAGIIHRLDRDTSGLIIIGKNQEVVDKMQELFKNREIIKKYKTLVWNRLMPEKGMIIKSIGRKPGKTSLMTTGRGKPAKTEYRVISYYQKNKYLFSFVDVDLKTGRTHQIRVHFKSLGHSLVGDCLYTKDKLNKISDKLGLKRLFLHSYYLKFKHPLLNKEIEILIDLPIELNIFLSQLEIT